MKKKLPSDSEIICKKILFSESVKAVLSDNRKTVKITVRDKLRLLNNELVKFKESQISYRIIVGLLADKLGLFVSEQTLREHCQNELGFVKRMHGKVNQKIPLRSAQTTQQVTKQFPEQQFVCVTPTTQPLTNVQLAMQTEQLVNQLENY